MSALDVPFIIGTAAPNESGVLGKHLPPLPPGMITAWLQQSVPPGGWVLDPFGSSPEAALEAARVGYRVLTCINNPVVRFILETQAASPSSLDFQGVLADIAEARKGDERLEKHIQSLYETQCQACRRWVQADAFLWNHGAENPYARVYTCTCGDSGERPVTPDDLRRLAGLPPAGLHRARAIERAASLDDPVRPDVEEALGVYLARPLYVLFNFMTVLDSLPRNSPKRAQLTALLLVLCDEATSLWEHPSSRHRHRQLSIPGQFREINLWKAIEKAAARWETHTSPVSILAWPEEAPPGAICLYPGRLKDLAANPLPFSMDACLAVIPRTNQPFWTLSAIWTGWLWGKEAMLPLKSSLNRHRYDWNWHSQALASVLTSLPQIIEASSPLFSLVLEAETPFLTALFLAAEQAHLELTGLALRAESEQAQLMWDQIGLSTESGALPFEMAARQGIQTILEERGEPSVYLTSGAAALASAARQHAFHLNPVESLGENMTRVMSGLRRVFTDRSTFVHYGGSEQSLDAGSWWLRDGSSASPSLADRVETAVRTILQDGRTWDFPALDAEICRLFQGLSTPPSTLIRACLSSYAAEEPQGSGLYRLRKEDDPIARQAEIEQLRRLICDIGERLGFRSEQEEIVCWNTQDGLPVYRFMIQATAQVDRIFDDQAGGQGSGVLVLPGGRSSLLAYKLAHNIRLEQAVRQGWHFLKFRHLRVLAANPLLDAALWEAQLEYDPPEQEAGAMRMF